LRHLERVLGLVPVLERAWEVLEVLLRGMVKVEEAVWQFADEEEGWATVPGEEAGPPRSLERS
jgi:hypothetical protein